MKARSAAAPKTQKHDFKLVFVLYIILLALGESPRAFSFPPTPTGRVAPEIQPQPPKPAQYAKTDDQRKLHFFHR